MEADMPNPTEVVQQLYAAFGRGDIPAVLELVANEVDWECVAPPSVAYAGRRRNREQVAAFFADIPKADAIRVFEPREFIASGEHVTVLGWEESSALETGKDFTSEWAHVFTVQDGRVTRWRGFLNTAARYGF
jgi:ketosteroid isomerase-like protein